ncbi:glycerophosphodiester phosphodiesterase family protein [Candidatus Poriferisocius sp.]|uniref:glycerophosphodiester phosphodiesterase family protein n=1 Tax=Candidatus Poriferisocius sp. TaxID=3101276 RepID=UPI003B5AAACC
MRRFSRTAKSLPPALVLLALMMVGALLAACGDADDFEPTATAAPVSSPTEIAPTATPPPTPEAVVTATAIAEPSTATPVATAPPEQPASEPTPVADDADVEDGVEEPGSEEADVLPPVPTPAASTVRELLALGRPLVIAHAGGDRSWPHSTMYAFSQAAHAGVDVLEMDLQMTADRVLVVHHDDTVDRTTNATGRVRDMTYEELQALDNAYWWSEEWPSHDLAPEAYSHRGIRTGDVASPPGYGPDDFRVETFRAVAQAFPEHVLDVEIKTPAGDDGEDDIDFILEMAAVLAADIEELGRTDSVVVVSFRDEALIGFRELAPDVVTSPGQDALPAWAFASVPLHPNDLILQVPPTFSGLDVLTPDLLGKAADEGLAVWVWPNEDWQEDPDYYAELIDLPVQGVIAGRPAEAVERFRADGDIP